MLINAQAEYASIKRGRVDVAPGKLVTSNVRRELYCVQILQRPLPAYEWR
jgi:hypothetical protein